MTKSKVNSYGGRIGAKACRRMRRDLRRGERRKALAKGIWGWLRRKFSKERPVDE
jgi:hypothetical protein